MVRAAGALARGLLLAMATATLACPSCERSDAQEPAADLDPGPTFGAEVTVNVVGRGRVVGRPGDVNCPSSCFARVVLADPTADGAEQGIRLVAEGTPGTHFVGWTLEAMDLGVRARGPSACSPMTRRAVSVAPFSERARAISLPFGETSGTPPRGHEAECAEFTAVPVAYAITATFEEDFPERDAAPDAPPDPVVEVLYERPVGAASQAKELGLAGGLVYWRFQLSSGLSGIAVGSAVDSAGTAIVPANQTISLFDVDRHVAYQRGGALYAIESGGTQTSLLGGAPTCAALATGLAHVYCRASSGATSTIYSWPVSGASSPTLLHRLPRGFALAVDDPQQRFYVSDDPGLVSGGSIASIPQAGDGGAPLLSTLIGNQTSPRNLVAGTSRLFWIDDRFAGTFIATSGSKSTPAAGVQSVTSKSLPFVAADPGSSSVYWLGIGSSSPGGSEIRRATSAGSSTVFRSNLTGLGGLAVDGTYVYWTQSDGRVYRAPKFAVAP